jgi:hypothetical protein
MSGKTVFSSVMFVTSSIITLHYITSTSAYHQISTVRNACQQEKNKTRFHPLLSQNGGLPKSPLPGPAVATHARSLLSSPMPDCAYVCGIIVTTAAAPRAMAVATMAIIARYCLYTIVIEHNSYELFKKFGRSDIEVHVTMFMSETATEKCPSCSDGGITTERTKGTAIPPKKRMKPL